MSTERRAHEASAGAQDHRRSSGGAHYGMLADFLRDARTAPSTGSGLQAITGSELVDNNLNRSANYFWQMWVQAEARKGNVQ